MLLPYLNKDVIEAGCDEAGRGCLAGAVYAAAVILPPDFENEMKKRSICGGFSENRRLVRGGNRKQRRALWSSIFTKEG